MCDTGCPGCPARYFPRRLKHSIVLTMTDRIPQWWSKDPELMDSIYDMTFEEEECIASSFPQSLHQYALFSTGVKLFRAMNHAGIC
jgi:hypothetical protein